MPIVKVPILGDMNYFQNGKGDGVIIILLALVSCLLILCRLYAGLMVTGGLSLAVLAYTFVAFQQRMSEARSQMANELAGNPFRGLAEGALRSVQLQWGWAVLVVGAVLIIAAGSIPSQKQLRVG